MIKVAFVCLGNICRSPMAELVFKNMIAGQGLADWFEVSSFGTSGCEAGSEIYPPAKRTLAAHGITGSHIARKITAANVEKLDYVLVMDEQNMFDLLRITGGKYKDKIFKLCSFTDRDRDVADPWYTRDFETAYRDITDGCQAFLKYVKADER